MGPFQFVEYCQLPHPPIDASKTNRIILESKAIANKTMPISLSKLSEYSKKAVVVTVLVKSGTSLYKKACQSSHAVPLSDL